MEDKSNNRDKWIFVYSLSDDDNLTAAPTKQFKTVSQTEKFKNGLQKLKISALITEFDGSQHYIDSPVPGKEHLADSLPCPWGDTASTSRVQNFLMV